MTAPYPYKGCIIDFNGTDMEVIRDDVEGKLWCIPKGTPIDKDVQAVNLHHFVLDNPDKVKYWPPLDNPLQSPAIQSLAKKRDFFEICAKELDKKIVDEHDARRTILLVALGGSLLKNAQPTSTNLLVNDESGAGKDYITRAVLKLLPKDKVVARKRITEKAFTYWHNADNEPEWTWDGKIFYNEDISQGVLNSDVFKVMSSSDGENRTEVVDKAQVKSILVKGKPAMIITTYASSPNRELLRRFPIVNLTTTQSQTSKILERQAEFAEKGISPDYDMSITYALQTLKRVSVKVPFARKLKDVLSHENIIMRTHFNRMLDYIKMSAAFHQKNRTVDDMGFVLAEEQDYVVARDAIMATTRNSMAVPISKLQQKTYDVIASEPISWTVNDLEPKITWWTQRTIYRQLDSMVESGFLEKDKEDFSDGKKPVMVYRARDVGRIQLPKNLQNLSSATTSTSKSSSQNVSNDEALDTLDTLVIDTDTDTSENNPLMSVETEDIEL